MQARFLTTITFLLTVFLLATSPLAAYIHNQRSSGAAMVRSDYRAIPYVLDSRTAPGLLNTAGQFTITPESDPLSAVHGALQEWTNVPYAEVRFAPFETGAGRQPRNDGVNLITFADTAETRSLVGKAVAVTFLYTRVDGVLIDTDIVFNPELRFSTEPDSSSLDIQGTLTHELGHALGLDHSGVLGATMFPMTAAGTNRIARLSTDDTAFVRDVYPSADAPQSFGEIQGRVNFSFAPPVEGAHVVAVDSRQNVIVAALSEADGSYRIGRLPAGRYWLYAEPLDGPTNPLQLGPTRWFPDVFPTNFFGGLTTPQQLDVAAGAVVAADMVVNNANPTLNIRGSSSAPAGASEPRGLLAELQPGAVFDIALCGDGLGSPEIGESAISFLGAKIEIVEGSLRRDPACSAGFSGAGFPRLAFRVEVAADAPAGLATILVSTSSEAAALSGGIAIVDPLPAPLFSSGSVTNAASFLSGSVAPGEIVSIFGSNLGPEQGVLGGLDDQGRVVTQLGGVTVTFNGRPAPLFFASAGQLNAQVPFELNGAANALVLVQRGQAVSAPTVVAFRTARPGLFTLPATSAAVVVNQDGSLNGASNAARRGAFVTIFGTGQGQTDPALATGQLAGFTQLSRVVAPVSVTIGGQPATVSFAGMAPGFAGLLQINVVVPPGSSTGPQTPVEVTIDGVATGQHATMAVE
jgi:uncharacterized protein (TIGR03437 family)